MFSSNAAKQLALAALQAEKTESEDIGIKAIDVGKTVAIDASKKLVGGCYKIIHTEITSGQCYDSFRGNS